MAALLKGRLMKLERKGQRPCRVKNTVFTIDAFTGEAIGPRPKGPCMVVMDFGDQWQSALLSQQEKLVAEAFKTENERHIP